MLTNALSALPSPFETLATLVAEIRRRGLALYLDFDGTLSELVDHHDDATPADGVAACLTKLKRHCDIAIITGRDPEDVRRRLGVANIAYAGNHGLRIVDKDGDLFEVPHQGHAALDAIEREIGELAAQFGGAHVERKITSRVLHFRKVEPGLHPTLIDAVDAAVAMFPELTVKAGKMVREVQPRIHWHKGHAVRWLHDKLQDKDRIVFIGDDVTDEDAFRVLGEGRDQIAGFGILVAETDRKTNAAYRLDNVNAVQAFLRKLADGLDNINTRIGIDS